MFAVGSLPLDILHANSVTERLHNAQKGKISNVLIADPNCSGWTSRFTAIPVADLRLNKQRSFGYVFVLVSYELKTDGQKCIRFPKQSAHLLFFNGKKTLL